MYWTWIVNFLGGSAILVGALAFLAKSLTTHFLSRDLERMKGDIKRESDEELQAMRSAQDKELQKLREAQESRMNELRREHELVIQGLQAQANERIELVRSALQRVERLESELVKNRDDAYGEIWKLSKCVNLFGPTVPVDCSAVSQALTDWYFTKGRLLTQGCRQIHFAIQEVLNYYHVRSIRPTRPAAEVLYCSIKRPVDVLIDLEAERLGIPAKGNLRLFSQTELSSYVDNFKARSHSAEADVEAENAWLLLHFLMSSFRSRLVEELGWRNDLQPLSSPERDQAPSTLPIGNGAPVVSSLSAQHSS